MEKGGGSRLLQMQARFQQKQMAEREMKIASLYEAQQTRALDKVRHSPSNGHGTGHGTGHSNGTPVTAQPPALNHQPGKVRQMFEERRTKGIDKSYPLQPIQNTERARRPLPNGYSKVSTTRVAAEKRVTKVSSTTHTVKKVVHQNSEHTVNGSGDLNHNHEPDLNALKHALPQTNGVTRDEVDKSEVDKPDREDNYLLEEETFPDALAPSPTPRSPAQPAPPAHDIRPPPRRSPPVKSSPAKPKAQPATTPKRVASESAVSEPSKPRAAMQRASQPKSQPVVKTQSPRHTPKSRPAASPSPSAASPGAGDACAVCGRRFAPDRLAKHQDICKKAHSKKRKPFDVLKHRLAGTDAEGFKGTEAEPFINKLRKGATAAPASNSGKQVNSNWRQKHEEFINAIRAAKQVQAHLQAGGKLSDLPPPPPSENPDYVKCPSCGRRFNQAAAERHIPKCKDFQFNKPKPAASRRR